LKVQRRTKSGLPKHCSSYRDRHGTRRVRFRKAGFAVYLTGTPWSENFMRQYAAALDGVQAQTGSVGIARTTPGTVNALAVAYYQSPDFRSLADSTKDHRRRIIDKFRSAHGDKPLKGLRREHIVQIMADKAETPEAKTPPEAANNLIKLLRVMLNHGVALGMIENNPAIGVKRIKNRGDGFHTFTENEIAQFEATHPIGTKARLALALLLHTGQRVSDVARMGWQHVTGDAIKVQQQKTGKVLLLPLHPELKTMLATLPRTNMRSSCPSAARRSTLRVSANGSKTNASPPDCRTARPTVCARPPPPASPTPVAASMRLPRSPVTRHSARSRTTPPRPIRGGSRDRP
jgi:integrase